MRSRTLLPHRLGPPGLAALALLGPLGLDATPAVAGTKSQIARQERYIACTARVQRDPPCNRIWTRYCPRECNALYY
jgi:hypothetical protein